MGLYLFSQVPTIPLWKAFNENFPKEISSRRFLQSATPKWLIQSTKEPFLLCLSVETPKSKGTSIRSVDEVRRWEPYDMGKVESARPSNLYAYFGAFLDLLTTDGTMLFKLLTP